MIRTSLLFLITIVLLSSCQSETDNLTEKNHYGDVTETEQNTIEESENSTSLVKKFIPPNFVIKNVAVNTEDSRLQIDVDYVISDKLYNILKDYEHYYFKVEFPKEIIDYTSTKTTEELKGPSVKDGELTYRISFNENLDSNMSDDLLKKMKNHELSFNLMILNNSHEMFHLFKDIQYFNR